MSGITETNFQRVMALVTMFMPDAVDQSKTRRFLKKTTHTFADVLEAIASCSPFFAGTPVSEDVVASCQKVVRDEIAGRPDIPSKMDAILQLIDALLRSQHRVRHNIKVDSPSGDYTLADIEAAILRANDKWVDRDLFSAVKRDNPAIADADYSQPSAIIAYVEAVNARIGGDEYNSWRIGDPDNLDRCKYPRANMTCYNDIGPRRAIIALETSLDIDITQKLFLRFRFLGGSFDTVLSEDHDALFSDVVHWLLTHKGEIGAADVRIRALDPPDDLGSQLQAIYDWADAAVASSCLFSCRATTHVIRQYRTHAGFVDLTTAN